MMNWSKGRWALQQLYIQVQDFSTRIELVASLHQVTGYSSSVNGKNQAKKKEKPRVCCNEEALHHGEEVHHGEGYCSQRQRGHWMKKPFSGSP